MNRLACLSMNEAFSVWLQFGACAALIAAAGSQLCRYGDAIADKTGLSGNWVGLVLLATVTSLPELATGLSAVALADAPDIAVGNVLGSCMVNLTTLAVLDMLQRGGSIYLRASPSHLLSAGFGGALIGLTLASLLLGENIERYRLGHVGWYAPLIALLYVAAVRAVFLRERGDPKGAQEAARQRFPDLTLGQVVWRYALAAVVVVGAGIWLPFIAARLAAVMDWHGTLVGTLFVALTTTLPELVVSISALRIGALDMAIANVLGSNLFNILILAIDDLFYFKGPILARVAPFHALSALSAVLMTALVIAAIRQRPQVRPFVRAGWASPGIVIIYLGTAYLLYQNGTIIG